MNIITYQDELRPALCTVWGAKDYREFREKLIAMDHILTTSGAEHRILSEKIEGLGDHLSGKRRQTLYRRWRQGLRYCLLLGITEHSYRELSLRAADSRLFQWFTYSETMGIIRPLSKSSIERMEKLFSGEEITQLIHELNRAAGDRKTAEKILYRETEIRFDEIFADTTCVKSPIHFPVDWVLLRDAVRTLIKAIIVIRSHGLYHRIPAPENFITSMNKLCIEMTHARKRKDSAKVRKHIFRRMKELMKIIESHGRTYCGLLEESWQETTFSEREAKVVVNRMKNILSQLPGAIRQAHERIIGERRVANKDKILSLYEKDVRVLVRGKAGAEVEFGNALYLAEQTDGLIVDWKFIREQPPGDNKLVKESLTRIKENYGPVRSYTADRGFDSPGNKLDLKQLNIFNAICPRSVKEFEEKREDPVFCRLQTRRGATEARIGIFKNAYLGKPLRSKGFEHRNIRIEWCILSHNLWKLAVLSAQRRWEIEEKTA